MKKIMMGLYQFGRKFESPSRIPLILVHPWYNEDHNKFKKINRKIPGKYLDNLGDLLQNSSNRVVIIYDEILINLANPLLDMDSQEDLLFQNAKRVSKLRGSEDGLYGVLTRPNSSVPFYRHEFELMNFIREFSEEVEFAGGQFSYHKRKGCLGNLKFRFDVMGFKTKLITDCCFR